MPTLKMDEINYALGKTLGLTRFKTPVKMIRAIASASRYLTWHKKQIGTILLRLLQHYSLPGRRIAISKGDWGLGIGGWEKTYSR
jgi:hypothetical protein